MSTHATPILVGYDGSPDADLALHWAVATAEPTATPVKVVVAAEESDKLPVNVRDTVLRWAHTVTADARRALSEVDVPTEVELQTGAALAVLLAAAADASLVVVGSRGHGLWDTLWMGSTSQHLVGRTACPVAVVRAPHNPVARRIVVGVDGSPASRRALAYAAERGARTGEEVLAVHAYHYAPFAQGGRIGALAQDIDTAAVEAAERLAAELVAGVAAEQPDAVVQSTAVVGRAGRVLSRLADDASLVVVGSRGRTGVAELVLGSVSHEVLLRAECPVVVVP